MLQCGGVFGQVEQAAGVAAEDFARLVEDDFVRQACLQECAAQGCACFDQEFADAAFRQQGEGGGQADAAVGGGGGQDVEMRDGGEGCGVFFGRDGG